MSVVKYYYFTNPLKKWERSYTTRFSDYNINNKSILLTGHNSTLFQNLLINTVNEGIPKQLIEKADFLIWQTFRRLLFSPKVPAPPLFQPATNPPSPLIRYLLNYRNNIFVIIPKIVGSKRFNVTIIMVQVMLIYCNVMWIICLNGSKN